MLWQVQDSGVISQRFKVLFRLTIFNSAYLRLSEAQPSSENFLIQRPAKNQQVAGMTSVCPEDFADVLTRERRPELVRLEKLILELGRCCAELIALLPVAPTAQACGVISRKHGSAARTASATHRTMR